MRVIKTDLSPYKDEFQKNGCVKLPVFLNQIILDLLKNGFANQPTKRFLLNEASTEFTFLEPILVTKLNVIFNDPDYLEGMSAIIGNKINFSKQRLSFIDSTCTSLPWHDDSYGNDKRLAAIRFELSDGPFQGGEFLYRNDGGEYKFSNLSFGESVLFKIETHAADHMVTPVTEGIRKSLSMFLCE